MEVQCTSDPTHSVTSVEAIDPSSERAGAQVPCDSVAMRNWQLGCRGDPPALRGARASVQRWRALYKEFGEDGLWPLDRGRSE